MTIPLSTQYYQAASGYPPLHPSPQLVQHANKLVEEILVYNFYPLAMQILSLIASEAPKAQQLPQFD